MPFQNQLQGIQGLNQAQGPVPAGPIAPGPGQPTGPIAQGPEQQVQDPWTHLMDVLYRKELEANNG